MEYRTLEITVQYAEDLKKVNFISKMDVYVVVSISGGDKSSKQKTKTVVNHDGDANPTWSFPMKFAVEAAALMQNRLMLDFEIKCERALGDRVVGEVHVPVKDLLDFPTSERGGAAAKNFVSYQVKKPSGKPKGKLTFSYQFGGKTNTSTAPLPQAAEADVHGQSTIPYPVVEPMLVSPYMMTASPGGYPPIRFPPEFTVEPPPLAAVEEVYDGNAAAYTVADVGPTSLYPPVALGVYPPIPTQTVAVLPEGGGGQYPPLPEWYAPQGYFGHPPPVMQLAPDWWIEDWRYDTRCSGF